MAGSSTKRTAETAFPDLPDPCDSSSATNSPKTAKLARPLRYANNEAVTFLVGPIENPTRFSVHKHQLIARIPHFEKAFGPNSKWEEARTNTCSLPGMTPAVFDLIVTWIYSGRLPELPAIPGPRSKKGVDEGEFSRAWLESGATQAMYHAIIHEGELWRCGPLASAALEALRRFHFVSWTNVPVTLIYGGLKEVVGTERTSEYKRWLMMCICADLMEGVVEDKDGLDGKGKGGFNRAWGKHERAALVLEDLRMDVWAELILKLAAEEKKLTVRGVMDPKRVFYEECE